MEPKIEQPKQYKPEDLRVLERLQDKLKKDGIFPGAIVVFNKNDGKVIGERPPYHSFKLPVVFTGIGERGGSPSFEYFERNPDGSTAALWYLPISMIDIDSIKWFEEDAAI